MTDREKVIKALHDARRYLEDKEWSDRGASPHIDSINDTLALLKEQEAVAPKTEPSAKGYWYTCGVCGWWLFEVRDTVHFDDRKRIHYCASCGRSVNWDA